MLLSVIIRVLKSIMIEHKLYGEDIKKIVTTRLSANVFSVTKFGKVNMFISKGLLLAYSVMTLQMFFCLRYT